MQQGKILIFKYMPLAIVFLCFFCLNVQAQEADEIQVPSSDDQSATALQGEPAERPVDETTKEDLSIEQTKKAIEKGYVESADDVMLEVEGGGKDKASSERSGRINFKGVLKERGTRKPLAFVTVYLKGTGYEAVSDKKGRFKFVDLPPGEYNPIVPTMSYERYETQETIKTNEELSVIYYLEPKVYGTLEVVVRGKKEKKEVSRKVLKMEEAKVIPGSQGDAVKVVQNLPGVARGTANSGGIVVRGSNAEDSRVLLDGHQIPLLFHFGALKSVYNSELLDEINLYTGGFGTAWGNATGGIVELKTRQPRKDRWGGYVDTSMLDASAMAEGPIIDGMGMAMAIRRSTVDLILPLVLPSIVPEDDLEFTTLPVYYDYQFKWDYKINKEHYVSFDWFGALDELKLVSNLVNDTEPEVTGEIGFRTMSHGGFIHYKFKRDKISSDFSPGFSFTEIKFNLGNDYFFKLQAFQFDIQEDIMIELNEHNTLDFGVQIEPVFAGIESNLVRPPKEGEVAYSFSNSEKIETDTSAWEISAAAYLNDQIRYGKWLLIPGVRFEYNSEMNDYSINPRGLLRYNVIDPLTLKASVGLYHRVPDFDERYEPYGNGGLNYERALHVVGGVEWDITEAINLDIQGYYKKIDQLVSAAQDPDSDDFYENGGEGYVIGGEILLRHNLVDNFFGWISYSVSKSIRNDGPGTPDRYFDEDQTHNLIVLASYRFCKTWQIGGRFQFTSGEPYTDINGGIFNADNGTYLPIFDQQNKNDKRTGLYHRLDIRLDKQWVFNTWILSAYLDVQNVYFHANPVQTVYNYDYSEYGEFKTIPILPAIGIKAEF